MLWGMKHLYVCDKFVHMCSRLYGLLYGLGFVMIIQPPVENGSPFWILKIFDTPKGVSLVHMNTCSHMHHTRVSQSIE